VAAIQRTDGAMRLNPPLHVVFLDGVYRENGAELTWQPLGHLQTREVGEVLERAGERSVALLRRELSVDGPWVTDRRGDAAFLRCA
jgi:hypothetical protein